MRVEIMKPNQYILRHYDYTIFKSYNSPIIRIDFKRNIITVFKDYCYSKTTSRNRNLFFNREGFSEIATTETLNKAIKEGMVIIDGEKYTVKKLD